MKPTPLPLVALLAACTGEGNPSTGTSDWIPPMDPSAHTGLRPPMPPPPDHTGLRPPMEPPLHTGLLGGSGDSGATTPPMPPPPDTGGSGAARALAPAGASPYPAARAR